jgi:hypothetical protein
MQKTTWVFSRNRQVLRIERREAPARLTVIRPDGDVQEYVGHADAELARIHTQLEAALRRDGWTLEEFTPERREHTDRRSLPRADADRRRSSD